MAGARGVRLATALGLLLYVALLFWVYRGLESSYFFRDDFMWLFDAQRQAAEPSLYLTWRPSGYFRPLSNLWFGLQYTLFGLEPRGYFAANVALLAWIGIWLGLVVRICGGSPARAFAAALLVSLSAVVAPSVVWISAFVSLLSIACLLPAVFFYQVHARTGRSKELWVSVFFVALTVCSRETGVLVGPLILGLELRENGLRSFTRGRTWLRLAPFVVLAVAYVGIQWAFLDSAPLTGRTGGVEWATWPGNVLANIPALLQWGGAARWLSTVTGGLLLGCVGGALLVLRGRAGAVEFAWLLALLVLSFLPTLLVFKGSDELGVRYRLEAALVACLFIAALFDALANHRSRVRRAIAGLLLFLYLGAHASGTAEYVVQNERFGKYAQESRKLAESLDRHLAPYLQGDIEGGVKFALIGAPIENERHLSSFLAVWYGLPKHAVESFRFQLSNAGVRTSIRKGGASGMVKATGSDTLLYWGETGLETEPSPLMPLLRKSWRRPWDSAKVAFVRVVEIPAL